MPAVLCSFRGRNIRKIFRFCWKVYFIANMAVLVKMVVSCYHILFSNFLQNHCVCIILKTFCFISDCCTGLVFTVLPSSITLFSFLNVMSYGRVLQVDMLLLKVDFFPTDAKLFKSLLLNLIACSSSLIFAFLCRLKAPDWAVVSKSHHLFNI